MRLEYLVPFVGGLDFHNHAVLHQKIQAQSGFQANVPIDDRDRLLPFHEQVACAQFLEKTGFIYGFEQAWPQGAVDAKRRIDDLTRDLIDGI